MVEKRKLSMLSPVEVKMYDEYVEKYGLMTSGGVVQRSFDDLATAINVECHDGNEVMTSKKLFRRYYYMKARQAFHAVVASVTPVNESAEPVWVKLREIKKYATRHPSLVQLLTGLVDAVYDLVIENDSLRKELRSLKAVQSAVENYHKQSGYREKV